MKNKRIKRTPKDVIAAYLDAGRQFERWFARLAAAVAKCQQHRARLKRCACIAEEMGIAGMLDLDTEAAADTRGYRCGQDRQDKTANDKGEPSNGE